MVAYRSVMHRAFILFVLVLTCWTAHARLGDSIAESDKYHNGGKPGALSAEDQKKMLLVGPGSSNTSYVVKGMLIRVGFKNGQTFVMEYKHAGSSKLTPDDFKVILNDNGGDNWGNFVPTNAEKKDPKIAYYIRACDGRILRRPDGSIAYTIGHQRAAILVYRALAK